jgi:hypothetical protein
VWKEKFEKKKFGVCFTQFFAKSLTFIHHPPFSSAIPHGAQYLKLMYTRFPEARAGLERWRFALGAYNTGRGNLNKAIKRAGLGGKTGLLWSQVAPETAARTYVAAILGSSGPMTGYAAGYGTYAGAGGSSAAVPERTSKRTGRVETTSTSTSSASRPGRCGAQGGACRTACRSSAVAIKGLCAGSAVCCVAGANKCRDRSHGGGSCVSMKHKGCVLGFTYKSLCPGNSDIKCCVNHASQVYHATASGLNHVFSSVFGNE